MKHASCIVAGLILLTVSPHAQAPKAGEKVGLSTSLQRNYETTKGNLTQAAARMPEADYGFKAALAPDIRTYAQLIGHQVDNQFINCALIKGVPSPSQGNVDRTTKAEVVKALADAFAFCDSAIAALTDQSLLQMVKQGEGETARGTIVAALLGHALETNGIATLYLRAKGLMPPAAPAGGREGRSGRGAQ